MEVTSYMENAPALYATAWAVLPPLIAIVLALITKEVYSSLFLGVVTGAILYAGADFDVRGERQGTYPAVHSSGKTKSGATKKAGWKLLRTSR